MRSYPDPNEHYRHSINQSADRYAQGLEQAGLEPSPKLTKAMARRAHQHAWESYQQEAGEIHAHNISSIMRNHDLRLKEIKRRGARLRLWTCPPIAILFGAEAWYSFLQPNGFPAGVVFTIGALAFFGMLVGGAIFDR